jgi:hypothetical protein
VHPAQQKRRFEKPLPCLWCTALWACGKFCNPLSPAALNESGKTPKFLMLRDVVCYSSTGNDGAPFLPHLVESKLLDFYSQQYINFDLGCSLVRSTPMELAISMRLAVPHLGHAASIARLTAPRKSA